MLPETQSFTAQLGLPLKMLMSRYVVHQNIEASILLLADALKQLFDLIGLGVIHLCPNAHAAARSHHLGCFLDGLWAAYGRELAPPTAPGTIDCRSRIPERASNTTPCSACSSGDDGYLSFQLCHSSMPSLLQYIQVGYRYATLPR